MRLREVDNLCGNAIGVERFGQLLQLRFQSGAIGGASVGHHQEWRDFQINPLRGTPARLQATRDSPIDPRDQLPIRSRP